MRKTATLILIALTMALAGCSTPRQTVHWEYKTEKLYLDAALDPGDLNKAAKDGWEFVSATSIPGSFDHAAIVVFKRRIQ